MLDLLVIGAGLSGLCAALTAAEAGQQVRVIAKGMGALYWHAGALDMLGYFPGSPTPVTTPLADSAQLPAQHPYRRFSQTALQETIDWLVGQLNAAGLPYVKSGDTNMQLPSPVGAIRPTYAAPAAQAGGNLADPAPMLLVGFHGLRDFYPCLIAENLALQGRPARALLLPLSAVTDRHVLNTMILAQSLEQPAAQKALIAAIRPALRPGERVGLPAVLGVDRHEEVRAVLERGLGAPVFEIPTLSPSVAGIRLFRALVRQLTKMKVRTEIGMAVINVHTQDQVVHYVETETSARPLRHRAQHFMLATGGILGGGFDSNAAGEIWETLFRLPLAAPASRTEWFHPHFLAPGGHPIFRSGVEINAAYQPVLTGDTAAYQNLFAAGTLLAHCDPIQERSLEGIAAATGRAAAQAQFALAAQQKRIL
jgi:glycerol-3-phosphate dehydrogenase subunit B